MSVRAYTGPVDPEKREHVNESIVAFMNGLSDRGIRAIGVFAHESSGDLFIWRVSRDGRSVDVQFPGVPRMQIRLDDETAGFDLRIDDVAYSWKAALDLVAERLGPADHMDDLRLALKAGRRVEIYRINENLEEQGLEANADLSDDARGARILDEAGRCVAEYQVDAHAVAELLKLGAVGRSPDPQLAHCHAGHQFAERADPVLPELRTVLPNGELIHGVH